MSEEKDLQEPDIESGTSDLDELKNFVDFEGIDDIDLSDNKDVFGGLGDVSDLGDLPDISEIEELMSNSISNEEPESAELGAEMPKVSAIEETIEMPEVSDTAEEPQIEVPDVSAIEESESVVPDIDALEEAESEVPDIAALEEAEVEVPDIAALEEAEVEVPDIDALEEAEVEVPDIDALEETENEVPDIDALEGAESEVSEMEATDGEAVGDDSDISSVDPEIDIEGTLDSLDVDMLDLDNEEGASVEEEPFALDDEAIADLPDVDALEDIAPAGSEESSPAGDIDGLLDGLLDDLDMNGTLGENEGGEESTLDIEPDDALADIMGLDEASPMAMDEEMQPEDDMEALFDASMVPDTEEKKEDQPGFFKKVFGNVVTDEIAEQERKAAEKAEEDAALKAEEDAKAAEEKAKTKEEKQAEKEAKKAEKKKEKEAKKAEKEAKKAEKKAEQEAEEAAELEIVGKLNKVGVAIIAIATIVFLAVEITGTNMWGYMSSKNAAENYFEMGKYTEAYQEAIGTKMRDKDADSYNKIKTVMKVQQSLNAYQNYERIGYYPEALNALLQGIKKYDANINTAVDLEVDDDMKKCRDEIITILQSEFGLSETEAYSLLGLDQASYTDQLINIGKEK